MTSNYTSINPKNRDEVLWLQLALAKLMPGPGALVHIGNFTPMTRKALFLYQNMRNLPVTGEADTATLAEINRELVEKGLTP